MRIFERILRKLIGGIGIFLVMILTIAMNIVGMAVSPP